MQFIMKASDQRNEGSVVIDRSFISLIGSKDDYKVDIDKGIGNITVDGKTVTDFGSSGNGQNHIEINGGVGTINLNFKEK